MDNSSEQQHVTFRQMRRSTSLRDMSNTSIFDSTMLSLPDTSNITHKSCCEDLQCKVDTFSKNLETATIEIDNLRDEISNLKTELAKCLKVIEVYKKQEFSDSSNTASNRKKKRLSMHDKNRTTLTTSSPTKEATVNPTKEATVNPSTTKCDWNASSNDIHSIKDSRDSPLDKERSGSLINQNTCETPMQESKRNDKSNIIILSSETSNRISSMIERTHLKDYKTCHYRTPRCGIKYLINNIDKKVQNFTRSDYCIIVIGEEDFRKTENYVELVTYIRDKLITLNHTNFIICVPTFKYMDNTNIMFNCRVDTFNNLIYLDAESHNYALILDSNLNLPYTWDTYNQRNGTLNNKGFMQVMFDLQEFIVEMGTVNTFNLTLLKDELSHDCTDVNINCPNFNKKNKSPNSTFFRL